VKTTSEDSVHIAYDVRGKGRSVLLLHGFGNDRAMWDRYGWTARLESEFKVITLDFRGCGESDKPQLPSAYSIDSHLADIEAVIAASGGGKPVVWGWSLGATVALHLASRGKVAATIAAGTFFGPIFTPAFIKAGTAEASGEIDRSRLLGMGTWLEVQPDQIEVRLLIYTGTNDGNVVKQLELQRKNIEAAGGELEVLQDCNHLELITETEKVAAIVEPFIRRVN
jgi:pimeloyl-ACP methyl ester carboxylesterase